MASATEDKPSGYSRLPTSEDKRDSGGLTPLARRKRAALDAGSAAAVRLGRGLRDASAALDGPAGTGVEELLGRTDLPELSGPDGLSALAARLDREGDLWRNVALRAMARVTRTDRIAQTAAVVAGLGELGLGGLGAMSALVGGEGASGRALVLAVSAVIVALAALLVARVAGAARRSQRDIQSEALARADLAELRLHRVGAVLACRAEDPSIYREALARLERDANAPPA